MFSGGFVSYSLTHSSADRGLAFGILPLSYLPSPLPSNLHASVSLLEEGALAAWDVLRLIDLLSSPPFLSRVGF